MSKQNIKKFKILLLGDSSVGKTSLLVRYTDDIFSDDEISTLGIDYRVKCIELDGDNIHLDLWDTAGQERFKAIAKNYFKGAHGFLFVYDITQKSSFEGMKHWIKEAEKNSGQFKYVIVGNKSDLEDARQVEYSELQELGENYNAAYFETSAKKNINVIEAFTELATAINHDYVSPVDKNAALENKEDEKPKKKKCHC